jgi:hypothetical protein
MLVKAREPFLFFVTQKRKHDFLYKDIFSIYEYLVENSDEQLPIIGPDRLIEKQTFFDIRHTVLDNAYEKYEEEEGFKGTEDFLNFFKENERELLEELSDDIIAALRYHQLFYISEHLPPIPGYSPYEVPNCRRYSSSFRPVRKVW